MKDRAYSHVITCGGQTKSYSVVEPVDGWEVWTAYTFPSLAAQGIERGICGAFVFSSIPGRSPCAPLLVPATNPILLGAEPGQIYHCPDRPDVMLPFCEAFPPFTPHWAVPADPLHAHKESARVLVVGDLTAMDPTRNFLGEASTREDVCRWCTVILNCARKGLAIEPAGDESANAWRACRDLARRIWRASR